MIRRLGAGTVVEVMTRRALVPERETPTDSVMAEAMAVEESDDAAGFRQGYADGLEAGEQDAARDYQRQVQALEAQVEQVLQAHQEAWNARHQQLDDLLHGVVQAVRTHEQAMCELAFELSAATLQQVFTGNEGDRTLIARLCERVAQDRRGPMTQIEVSSADRALLPEHIDGLPIIESLTLTKGECRLTGEYGASESSIAGRLSAIFESMLDALGVRDR